MKFFEKNADLFFFCLIAYAVFQLIVSHMLYVIYCLMLLTKQIKLICGSEDKASHQIRHRGQSNGGTDDYNPITQEAKICLDLCEFMATLGTARLGDTHL